MKISSCALSESKFYYTRSCCTLLFRTGGGGVYSNYHYKSKKFNFTVFVPMGTSDLALRRALSLFLHPFYFAWGGLSILPISKLLIWIEVFVRMVRMHSCCLSCMSPCAVIGRCTETCGRDNMNVTRQDMLKNDVQDMT